MEVGMDDIFNTSDSKVIDIVYHPLCEDSIRSETISENIRETVIVKTENVKIENIRESKNLIKTEDTSDDNGQEVVEVQQTDEQQVLNFSNDLNGISLESPKSEHPKKTDFADRRTRENTSSEEIKAKIKVIKAPVIPVKSHEYISLAKNKHVCNHCQQTCKKLENLKVHIRTKHREVITMYQCFYCSFKSKWRTSLRMHIFHKHKGTRDNLKYCCDKCNYKSYNYHNLKSHKIIHLKPEEILYFNCYHCSFKSKHKGYLKTHILMHFHREEIKFDCYICDFTTLKRDMISKHLKKHFRHHTKSDEAKRKYQLETHTKIRYHYCSKCNYKTYTSTSLKGHKIIHLKPEKIQYFCCYHCSFKSKHKGNLKTHIFRHFQKEEIKFHCYICDFMTLKRDMIIKHLKKHFKHHTKTDEAKRNEIRYHYCSKCNYKTYTSTILKRHKIIHLKPEEVQYFCCYHCSFKFKQKHHLKTHILRHFQKEEIKFHCYICDFMTLKRDMIIKHLKKHFKHHTKSDEAKRLYQLENYAEMRYHYCNKCNYKTDKITNLKIHKIIHLKPEEIQYFYCYHCSFKSKRKNSLKTHIFRHVKMGNVPFHCYICDFMTFKRELIIGHVKNHSKVQIKSEINEGS